jgi:hypothetical protein
MLPLAAFIHHFFTLKANQASISSGGVLPSGFAMLYYVPYAQLFHQPPLVHNREHSHCSTIYLTSPHTPHRTEHSPSQPVS